MNEKKYSRRELFPILAGAGVAAREALRAKDAQADILPGARWHSGMQDIILRTNETGQEHAAAYAKGGTESLSNFLPVQVMSRSEASVLHRVDIAKIPANTLSNNHTYFDIHTHPPSKLNQFLHAWRGETDALQLDSIPKDWHDRNVCVPPTVAGEIRAAAEKFHISRDVPEWNPQNTEGVVVETRTGDIWYFTSATKEEMRNHFGDKVFQEIGYAYDTQPRIFLNRAMNEVYHAAIHAQRMFILDSARYDGNFAEALARGDAAAKSLFKAFVVATARLGIVVRYVPKEEFGSEPPAAGALYKRSILHTP